MFYSNIHHEDNQLEHSIVSLPKGKVKGFQVEANAPLKSFSPYIALANDDLQAESAETMSLAESRRSARVQHLQAFRENLEKRVKARAEQQMALEEVRDGLFKEKTSRLLKHANLIKWKPKTVTKEKSIAEKPAVDTIWRTDRVQKINATPVPSENTPMYNRLRELERNAAAVRKDLLRQSIAMNKRSDAKKDHDDEPKKERTAVLSRFEFSKAQRAQIVADVRIAYMNVERNNVRTRAKHDKKMESNLIKRNQHATLANMNYDMGDIIIDATAPNDVEIVFSSQNRENPIASPTKHRKKSSISKPSNVDNARYVTALQSLDSATSICNCPKETACANNCAFFNNTKAAKRLAERSLMQPRMHPK